MIPALVLTAGLATRLRPLSFVRAKATVPVAGVPLIRRILRWLRASGVTDVVLNLHHLPHSIARCVGDGSDLGVRVRYSWEVPLLGLAGGPRLAAPLLDSSTFLIVNGDTLTTVPIGALIEAHRHSGVVVTMAVTAHGDRARYGGVLAGDDGAFTGFTGRGSAVESRHFVGVQVVESAAFASVPTGAAAESIRGVYPALIKARPGSVRVHECEAEFFDIGTPSDYLHTSLLITGREGGSSVAGQGTHIDATARVTDSVLWDNVVIGAGARLHRCIVTDGVEVPEGASWNDVTIRRGGGELGPDERCVDGVAVGPLSRS